MDRELLKKARDIEEKLSVCEMLSKVSPVVMSFYGCFGSRKFDIPKDLNYEIVSIISKYKSIYEKQLEEL